MVSHRCLSLLVLSLVGVASVCVSAQTIEPELPRFEAQTEKVLQELGQGFPDSTLAHIRAALAFARTRHPQARLTSSGAILVFDSAEMVNGVPIPHQRWMYPRGVEPPRGEAAPWLQGRRAWLKAHNLNPERPYRPPRWNVDSLAQLDQIPGVSRSKDEVLESLKRFNQLHESGSASATPPGQNQE